MDKKQTQDGKLLKAVLKGTAKSSSILIISSVLLTQPLNHSYTMAYFTDKISTANHKNLRTLSALNSLSSASVNLSFDVHNFNNLAMDLEIDVDKNLLIASLRIPSDYGFEASDIIINSLELFHDNEVIKVPLKSAMADGAELQLIFKWSDIEGFISSEDSNPTLKLTGRGAGKGLSGLGERFVFSGRGSLPDLAIEEEIIEEIPAEIPGEETGDSENPAADDENRNPNESNESTENNEGGTVDEDEKPTTDEGDKITVEDETSEENVDEASGESEEIDVEDEDRTPVQSEEPAKKDEDEASDKETTTGNEENAMQESNHPETVSWGRQHNYASWKFILDTESITFFRRV